MFIGFVPIGTAINFGVLFVSSNVPVNSSVAPSYRVYGNAGLMTAGTGSLTVKDSGSVTGATNASPIQITSNSHGLSTGTKVTIAGVTGNTAAVGTFTVTVVDPNNFTLDGTTGSGSYTGGGTWNVSGLYNCSITPTTGNGYAQGGFYDVLVSGNVGGTVAQKFRFGVI